MNKSFEENDSFENIGELKLLLQVITNRVYFFSLIKIRNAKEVQITLSLSPYCAKTP